MTDNPAPAPAARKQDPTRLIVTLALISVVGQVCLGACVGGGVFVGSYVVMMASVNRVLLSGPTAPAEASRVVDEFMEAMAGQDAASAYALYSRRAQRIIAQRDLEALLAGADFARFEGYRAITIEAGDVTIRRSNDLSAPQGTVAHLSGRVIYTSGIVGTYTAILELEGGDWRLDSLSISLPADKPAP